MTGEIGAGCDITVVLPHYECAALLRWKRSPWHTRWFLVIVDDDSPCLDGLDVLLRSPEERFPARKGGSCPRRFDRALRPKLLAVLRMVGGR
jgi:hypothetical protein